MKRLIVGAWAAIAFAGCTITDVSRAPASLAGEYMSLIDLFDVRLADGRHALALPDSEFFAFQQYRGAPSAAAWTADPFAYPHVVAVIPAGTKMLIDQVRNARGFAIGLGFGRRTDVVATVEGSPDHAFDTHDLLAFSDSGEATGVNPAYLRRTSERAPTSGRSGFRNDR